MQRQPWTAEELIPHCRVARSKKDLGDRIGVTRERARQLVKKFNLVLEGQRCHVAPEDDSILHVLSNKD